jgi:hypothetical protein
LAEPKPDKVQNFVETLKNEKTSKNSKTISDQV